MPNLHRLLKNPVWLVAALALLCLGPRLGWADERILSFTSDVVVNPDASLTVTETITVRAEGKSIKRGIVREFPTTYRDRYGGTVRVGFQVEEAKRDGRPEPFRVEDTSQGKKIYLGDKNVILRPGVYTYGLTYRTNRQVGFFKDFDELYWNATGTDWTFPIDSARAVIQLPAGTKILKTAAYTGPFGAQGQDYRESRDHWGRVTFTTTKPLGVKEGLTVAVAWPKGVVAAPPPDEKLSSWLDDNLSSLAALAGLILVCCYYVVVWWRVGRDPARGTIIPLFTPPPGFSPPGVRYLMRMGYDQKAFAAAVVNMAVKGYLRIEEDDAGDYTLRRTGHNPDGLSAGEKRLGHHLFERGDALKLKNDNHVQISESRRALRESLDRELHQVYFHTNRTSFVLGLGLTALTLAAVVLTAPNRAEALFATFWLSLWSVGCCFLAVMVRHRWQRATAGRGFRFGKTFTALAATLFALPFFVGEAVGLGILTVTLSLLASLVFAVMILLNCLFYFLLKAPTLEGRRLMDQLEGFKLYLAVAEQDRLEMLHPPEKTPELFEKYLPFALALDVENEWSEQFAAVLARAQVDGQPYSPAWYRGGSWHSLDTSRFSDSLGSSLASAIASSASPPGSSSGSGGGGFSGGGGGGGGGSGW